MGEVMPLLYFGILALLVAGILAFTQTSLAIGRLPFWWYLVGLGLIAIAGALAAAHADAEEEFHEGDPVGTDLVAVRTEDWEALQAGKEDAPDWAEEARTEPLDPLTELRSLHEQLDRARESGPRADASPLAAGAIAPAAMVAVESAPPRASPPVVSPETDQITSRVPPSRVVPEERAGPSSVAVNEPELSSTRYSGVRRVPRPRCASCDRDSVSMDPTFRCSRCGRSLCTDCAARLPPTSGTMVCPVCRVLDGFSGRPSVRGSPGGAGSGPSSSRPHSG